MDIEALRRMHTARIERVQHATPECVGMWWVGKVVQCPICGASYPYEWQTKEAALAENRAGGWLRKLAVEGRYLLQKGG